jgi:uncharacterized membrane protein YdjX (TVP38/TMEM64 family)
MTEKSRRYIALGYLSVALAGIMLCKVYGIPLFALPPSMAELVQPVSWTQALGMCTFTVAFVGCVFFSIPVAPLFYVASGYYFGVVEGTAVAALATTLASLAAFQFFKKTIVSPAALRKLEVGNLFFVLLLLRCSPWFPSALINLFCGVFRVRASVFVASTLIGTLPLICVYTLAASKLRGHLEMSLLYSPEILASLIVLSVISLGALFSPLRRVTHYLQDLLLPA